MIIALHIPELLATFIVFLLVYMYHMHFNLVTLWLWPDFQLALHFSLSMKKYPYGAYLRPDAY